MNISVSVNNECTRKVAIAGAYYWQYILLEVCCRSFNCKASFDHDCVIFYGNEVGIKLAARCFLRCIALTAGSYLQIKTDMKAYEQAYCEGFAYGLSDKIHEFAGRYGFSPSTGVSPVAIKHVPTSMANSSESSTEFGHSAAIELDKHVLYDKRT